MNNFINQKPICYKVMKRNGKQYALFNKSDIEQAINYVREFQCYVNRFYNITVKPYRGKYWNNNQFVWLVEG
jgi:hypothetical protein